MLVGIRGNVERLKSEGKSLSETIAAKPTAAWDDAGDIHRARLFGSLVR